MSPDVLAQLGTMDREELSLLAPESSQSPLSDSPAFPALCNLSKKGFGVPKFHLRSYTLQFSSSHTCKYISSTKHPPSSYLYNHLLQFQIPLNF